ncbi:5-formyltetrahydrofolate cyclo-ligase [Desulfosudis oleivorans]|uniref:5-formyltetrahydrofolate cyclo-ligase n=1 Tax=Desulfosudis oleivorans (strain DSM 6200 / JCM 39069 / Hxd3) TaxID=96561 RepID=A8ZXS0_DESOH|nr:5-formyltetrahydrofolate cyclo-ligase [Desulfosudis oleivorans]ABW68547.1 5-formyltetrahydrofolate cyclo-ligase [Desulfosudis oleivorans Hxd3]
MDDVKEIKQGLSAGVVKKIGAFTKDELSQKSRQILTRLFGFANFMEARVVFIYLNKPGEVDTRSIIKHCFSCNKVAVVPYDDTNRKDLRLLKLNDPSADFITGPRGETVADPNRCRVVPIDSVEIAIIPGLVFDEKGARIGLGTGYYDKLIPKLPATTRKVSLAFEDQIIAQVPKGSIDRHVDIIITEDRVIYKI